MEDNVVIPPESSVITFMIILTAADVPHHTLDLICRTFHATMVCSHHACIVPQANSCKPICFAIATERKISLKPQPSSSTSRAAKTHQVYISQIPQSTCGNLEDFANLDSLNPHGTMPRGCNKTIGWTCCLSITPMIKIFSNLKSIPKEHSNWVKQMAKRSAIVDSLLVYRDKFMEDPHHYRIMIPHDIQL